MAGVGAFENVCQFEPEKKIYNRIFFSKKKSVSVKGDAVSQGNIFHSDPESRCEVFSVLEIFLKNSVTRVLFAVVGGERAGTRGIKN